MLKLKKISLVALWVYLISVPQGFCLPLNSQEIILESYAAEGEGRTPQAIEKMVRLFNGAPNDYFINFRLGWLFYLDKKYTNSANHYASAARIEPGSVEARLGQTLALLAAGDYGRVVEVSRDLLKLDPKNYLGQQRMIQAYLRLKDYSNAAVQAYNALKSYPSDVVFLEQYGFILNELGRTEDAKKTLGFLFLISPKNVYARSVLGAIKAE